MKTVFLAEKPSQAQDYIKTLGINGKRCDGYVEGDNTIVTWCVGHLVTMSYPEEYDPALKKWSLDPLPFIPDKYKYEVIKSVKKQFSVVKKCLTRDDVGTIYFVGDSGREGQYIEELVIMMCGAKIKKKKMYRVWIDSTTDAEIRRGIREAKDMSAYSHLGDAGFLRAKEDYLMGINFSRALTLRYGDDVKRAAGAEKSVIAVGRVMSCVLYMIVSRENEIRNFTEESFYRITGEAEGLEFKWKAVEGSKVYQSPLLYSDEGFKDRAEAEKFADLMDRHGIVEEFSVKKEKKAAPLLYNLAELQSDCSKALKIAPDETLAAVQRLYEAKLVTYPRTDARVLTSAVADEIGKNVSGLCALPEFKAVASYAAAHLDGIKKTKYVDDKKVTDHYAIIPTGQGMSALGKMSDLDAEIYRMIVRRFLAIFSPAAEYEKITATVNAGAEKLFCSKKTLVKPGYLGLYGKKADEATGKRFKKGDGIDFPGYAVKEGKTKAPQRYTSGSIILAMENAGKLIEDEDLREQISGCGIGTSATRAATIAKLEKNGYIKISKKSQVITPTKLGEAICLVVAQTIPQMLSHKLTASWEKGLSKVEHGEVTEREYREKMEAFVRTHTEQVKATNNAAEIRRMLGSL